MSKRCPSCGYAPIGPFTDNCPICAEPVRNVRSGGRGYGGGGGGMSPVVKWILIGGVSSLALFAGCCALGVWRIGGAFEDAQKQLQEMQAQQEADRKARTVVVSAAELLREFKEDANAADQKYVGKYLELTGVIERTAGGRRGNPYIVLHGGDEAAKVKIECHISYMVPADDLRFRRLRQGQTITIRGEYMGLEGHIQVEECLLSEAPQAAPEGAK